MGQRQQPLQLRRIEADQIEIEALVAQPSQLLLNQGTRNNPLAIRLRNSSSGRSDQPNPARRTKKKRSAFTSSNLLKICGNDPSAKKTSRRGTAITGEPLMHPSEEKGGFRHPLPRARTQ